MAALTASKVSGWDPFFCFDIGIPLTIRGAIPTIWEHPVIPDPPVIIGSMSEHGESLLYIIARARQQGIGKNPLTGLLFQSLIGESLNNNAGFLNPNQTGGSYSTFGGNVQLQQNQTLGNIEVAFGIASGALVSTLLTGQVPATPYTPGGPLIGMSPWWEPSLNLLTPNEESKHRT